MSILRELQRRNVLRVAAGYVAVSWLIVQVMDTLSDAFALTGEHIRIAVIVLGVCFIPVMIIAWVFELTPEGFKRDADVERDTPAARKSQKRLDRIALVALALAVAYFVIDELLIEPQQGPTTIADRSIAVLPFINMSADPEQEYFSDGISEELLNLLARIPELRVISRSSAFSYKGKEINIPDVGRELNVAHVLEGSVRKAGNTIRITAQLIHAPTDQHVWSDTWDRELVDVFAIQDEIAAEVVRRLQITLLSDVPRVQRGDPRAFELTAMAKMAIGGSSRSTPEVQEKGTALLQQALDIDPDYVPAIILLANLQYWEFASRQRYAQDEFEEMLERWAATVRRAKEIDPTHPDVVLADAWVKFELDGDLQSAADGMVEAVALAPSDFEVLRVASAFGRQIGRFDASIRLAQRWSSIDPFCKVCDQPWRAAFRLYEAGRFDEALDLHATIDPESEFAYTSASVTSAQIYLLRGDPETALEFLDRDFERYDNFKIEEGHVRAIALWQLGRREEAIKLRAEHEALADMRRRPLVALEYAWMDDKDKAFEILNELYWPHMYGFRSVVHNPMWQPLVDDPRWRALLEQSGFTPEALAAIRFDPQLPY